MKAFLFSFLVLILIPGAMSGQVENNKSERFSYFLADVSYSSDAVFMGRRDSIKAPYLLPSIGYYDKSGLFADASASYLLQSGQERIDLFLLSAGYMYTGEQFSAGISGTKYFFDNESYNVQSEIEADLTGLISYDFKVAEITLSTSGYFGTSSPDIVANIMLDHTFSNSDYSLLISPAVVLSGGTQYFYEEYYNTSRLGNRKGSGNNQQGPGPGGSGNPMLMQSEGVNVQIREASEFNLLNIEARVPIQYYHKGFIFSFTPVVAFPQTSATIITEDGFLKEDLESVFYWSAGISYWIKTN